MSYSTLSKIAISLSLVAVVGCKEKLTGSIEVNEPISLKAEKGNANIPVGTHDISLEFSKKDRLKVEVKANKKKLKAEFKVPSMNIPDKTGHIEITAAQSGQPYDLVGEMVTTEGQSQERWEWETCTRPYHGRYYCHPGHRNYGGWCDRYGTSIGQRQVRYFDRITRRTVALNVEAPTSKKVLGAVKAKRDNNERIYTFMGPCH